MQETNMAGRVTGRSESFKQEELWSRYPYSVVAISTLQCDAIIQASFVEDAT